MEVWIHDLDRNQKSWQLCYVGYANYKYSINCLNLNKSGCVNEHAGDTFKKKDVQSGNNGRRGVTKSGTSATNYTAWNV